MIDRYSRPEMAALWSDQAKLQRWLDVELAVCRAWSRRGVIPADDLRQIEERAAFSVERSLEIEKTTNHDVVAFLTNVNENIGPASRWVHYGMTSSDVLDTGMGLALKQAGELLLAEQRKVTAALSEQARVHAHTPCVGRTHGIHAEPTTFGLKLAGYAAESRRNEERIARATAQAAVGTLSGAVGTYAMLDPALEAEVMDELGLVAESFPTQVVARDRHAEFMTALAIAATGVERLAIELRHLQRTELREAEEAFRVGQKGSSAMPHKRNPITAERLTGCARIIRANAIAGLENVALWHERDISHSSVERVILPDSTILLDHMLASLTKLVQGLVVSPARMQVVLDSSHGLVYSQRVLLGLVERGLTREEAYAAVQRNAMRAWDEGVSLRELLAGDSDVSAIMSEAALDELMDPAWYTRHVDGLLDERLPGSAAGHRGAPRQDTELREAIIDALRSAQEPVREAALYERIATRVADGPSEEHFLDTAAHLAVEGHLTIVLDHEESGYRDPAPFLARFYRLVRD